MVKGWYQKSSTLEIVYVCSHPLKSAQKDRPETSQPTAQQGVVKGHLGKKAPGPIAQKSCTV